MRPILAVLLLVACASESPFDDSALDTGHEAGAEVTTLPVPCEWSYGEAWAHPPEPFRADILSVVGGARFARLSWLPGGSTELRLELGAPANLRLGSPTVEGPGCEQHALVDLILEIATEDGLLDERLEVTARMEEGRATIERWLPLHQLEGDLSPAGVGSYDLVDLGLVVAVDPVGSHGRLTLHIGRQVDGRQEVEVAPLGEWRSARLDP